MHRLKLKDKGNSIENFIEIDGKQISLENVVGYELKRKNNEEVEISIIYNLKVDDIEIDSTNLKEVNKSLRGHAECN